jgi:hypothetical protein
MKIKKQLGSDSVRDLVDEASTRAQRLPHRSVQDPWPSSRRVISDTNERESNESQKADE